MGAWVTCYGKRRWWDSAQDAMRFYLNGWVATMPSAESERYARIFLALKSGQTEVTDAN